MPHGWLNRSGNLAFKDIHQHLNLYSAAAMAAGVSVLALAHPAEGSVVVTKTNITVGFGSQISIDINKDGINDFTIAGEGANYDHSFYATFAIQPLTGGKVVGGKRGPLGPYASALVKGANIGPSAHFSSSVARSQITIERLLGEASASTHESFYGEWPGINDRYLGVKFLIKGATHYGWIRMSVSEQQEISGTITEYAYETVTNKKIGAGDTTDSSETARAMPVPERRLQPRQASLSMLAQGADGLAMWRREQEISPARKPVLQDDHT